MHICRIGQPCCLTPHCFNAAPHHASASSHLLRQWPAQTALRPCPASRLPHPAAEWPACCRLRPQHAWASGLSGHGPRCRGPGGRSGTGPCLQLNGRRGGRQAVERRRWWRREYCWCARPLGRHKVTWVRQKGSAAFTQQLQHGKAVPPRVALGGSANSGPTINRSAQQAPNRRRGRLGWRIYTRGKQTRGGRAGAQSTLPSVRSRIPSSLLQRPQMALHRADLRMQT